MATLQSSTINGINGHNTANGSLGSKRFSDIPSAIDVNVSVGDEQEAVEIDLVDLIEDPTELCTMLEIENVTKSFWLVIAMAYAKKRKADTAIEILNRAIGAFARGSASDRLSILSCLCWMYLLKCRDAPRIPPQGQSASEVRTKEYYAHCATQTLNEASRISPSYPPLFLARGVLYLLRASLCSPNKNPSIREDAERQDMLRQAAKCFEDALRVSSGKNLMAILGKARVYFAQGKYADALQGYQTALERRPDLLDPDPRIGIGCCFWQLGYKDDAKTAWQRSLEMNPNSKIANILLGIYYLYQSSQFPTTDPKFAITYKKAMTQYTQKAFKLDDKLPLTCATFGGYFLMRKAFSTVEILARRGIELTDVNAIASDGWYLLARKEHYNEDMAKAAEYYQRADQARGSDERGFLPAKFGAAQIKVLMQDFDGAKYRLEKLIQQSKCTEAMTLLGTLYAEDVFASQATNAKEDKSVELKKAISLLESVRVAWKDPKRNAAPDVSVLLNLARLYEMEHPEKSLQCLEQVEQLELERIPEESRPNDIEDSDKPKSYLRELLPPQLLNNMGCFHYHAERYAQARDLFQTALNACVKVGDKDATVDTDALVTTIGYNLARTYEAEKLFDEAKKVYAGLLDRHTDYTDANTRLTYISLLQNPNDEGPKAMRKLYEAENTNIEVRALQGWFLSKAKKKTMNPAEDAEQRHYKHTLQQYDKHDRYSLTGMGNIHLQIAREMPRSTEQDKERRRRMYEKAVEFFDKVLQLDPRNAYAAQGIAIAMIEDKKDFTGAIQIFSKVKETLKDASVFINLGHAFCELKQYSRAIENYEAALAKEKSRDTQILTCLGRVWLMKGKQEKDLEAIKTSLEYSKRALEVSPENVYFQFNVAFVQYAVAQLINNLPETKRTLADLEQAASDLDGAIASFYSIAKSSSPPYPRQDIEQRANMGNTMRKQLERAITKQREYEEKNAARLQQAKEVREAEIRKRDEVKRKQEEEEEQKKRRIAEERRELDERDRELAMARAEEERLWEEAEFTTDEETGEKTKKKKASKRKGSKRKKKGEESESDREETGNEAGDRRPRQRSVPSSATSSTSDEERPRRKKKRKLERRGKNYGKFKSSELVIDSDSEGDAEVEQPANGSAATKAEQSLDSVQEYDIDEDEDIPRIRKKVARVINEDEDEDDQVEDETALSSQHGDVNMNDVGGSEDGDE